MEDWRACFEAEAIERAQRYDSGLDVEALGRELAAKAGTFRNPTAVFVAAAKRAKAEGTHRKGSPGGQVLSPKLDRLARSMVDLFAAAARGATPLQVAEAVDRLAREHPGLGLEQVANQLAAEAIGWPVRRPEGEDEDLPF